MAFDSNDILLAGAARADITPPVNCLLGGFAGRDHGCEGMHDPLSVTALALSRHGRKGVILGIDLLGLTDGQMDEIWKRSGQRFGLEPGQLFVNCSHTHAGPLMSPHFNSGFCTGEKVCLPDTAYVERFIETTVGAIGRALDSLQPACASWGIGKTYIGINRRAQDVSLYSKEATGYENFPNPGKETDRSCPVIMVNDRDGRPIALVFGASCHPTTMRFDNYLISAEFPGVTRRILEEGLDGALSIFLQGTAGDVKPRQVADGNIFRSGTYNDIEVVGKELADDVKTTIKDGLKPLDVDMGFSLRRFQLPFDDTWNAATYRRFIVENEAEYRRVWAEHWLKKIQQGVPVPKSMDLALSIFEVAPDLRFLGIAGELLTDMGRKIRQQFSRGTTLAFGYTNGDIGYIPDADVLREGGYEATETVFYMGDMPAPWHEDMERVILDGFVELKKNISGNR
ncbi:neutral/alkaline non-lysosomal ceramidase N-terminal domain-containing protein [bacterium]|nr:neutral/alkaline non-lysosomal ceramidase N-terminal domain-containing protein [bacterium]